MLEISNTTVSGLTLSDTAVHTSNGDNSRNLSAEAPDTRARSPRKNSGNGRKPKAMGLEIKPLFTVPDRHPCDAIEWERRKAVIKTDKGEVVFEADDIEVPAGPCWQPTSSHQSIFMAHMPPKHAKNLCGSWCIAWRAQSPIGDWRMVTSRQRKTRKCFTKN